MPAIALGAAAASAEPGLSVPPHGEGITFEMSFPASAHPQPITGRLFLMISRVNDPEVRLQSTWYNSPEMLAINVHHLQTDQVAVIDGTVLGTPLRGLNDVPPGDYYVQAVLNVYTEFHRADGRVLWAHMDRGEGQQFNRSPGNLFSKVQKLHLDRVGRYHLNLSEIIPPIVEPMDTDWVKHIHLQSKLLTQFWGAPIYVGAVVLLPMDYTAHPDKHYPTIYYLPEHYRAFPPFEFNTENPPESENAERVRQTGGYESGYDFYRAWRSDHFPRMIAVSIQTPTPLSDWSGGVDSANNGPYGRAIVSELIPYIERHFRAIPESYARVLTGKHSGGRAALALQILHPRFFGGVWAFHPWAFNFESYFGVNIHCEDNVFIVKSEDLPELAQNPSHWAPIERPFARTTDGIPVVSFRQISRHDAVLAGMAGGDTIGADDAILGPVGPDGYPKPLWDRGTGSIDRSVAVYWRKHSDVALYAKEHWPEIGAELSGKLHIYVGDMDQFYRNYGVHAFEISLKSTQLPYNIGDFEYEPLSGGWQPISNAALVRLMADHIAKHAPPSFDTTFNER